MALKATFDADFGSFLTELSKAEVKLRGFEPTTDKVGSKLQKMADSLDGNKLFTQAGIAAAGIEKIGGAANLSASEVAKFGRQFDEASSKARAMGVSLGTAFDGVHRDLQAMRTQLATVDTATQRFGAMGQAVMQGLGMGAGLGVAGVVQGLVSSLGAVVTEGNKLAGLSVPFERMAGGAAAAQFKLQDLRQATRGLVSDSELLTASNQATVLGLDKMGLRFADVARVAGVLAQSMGQDVGKGVSDLVGGLAKGSAEVLNNLGVIIRAEDAYKNYAARLGTTADELTDVQRQTAVAVVGFEQATAKAAELGEVPLTSAQHWDRLLNAITSVGAKGAGLVTEFSPFRDLLGEMAGFAEAIRDGLQGSATSPAGFGPGATGGASSYGGPQGLPDWARLDRPQPRQFISAGPGGMSIIDGRLEERRAADLARAGKGIAEAHSAIGRAAQQRAAAEQRIARLQALAGFGTPGAGKPKKPTGPTPEEKERQRLLAELTGATRLDGAVKAANLVFGRGGVGLGVLSDDTALKMFDQLLDARTIGTRLQSPLVGAITGSLDKLAAHPAIVASTREASQKLVDKLFDPASLKTSVRSWAGVLGDEMFRIPGVTDQDLISSKTPMNWMYLRAGVEPAPPITRADKATRDWAKSLVSVSQAFAQLSQIAGDAFANISRTMGGIFGSANVALEVVKSLGEEFPSLLGKKGKGLSQSGGALAGALAGIGTGTQLGGLFTNRGAGFAVGAAGGAASGALATMGTPAMPIGIAVGAILGGFTGMWTAAANAKSQRRAKDASAAQLTAQFGGLDKLLNTVGGLGLNQQSFLERFYGKPEQFAKAVTELNSALEKERLEAERLTASLTAVQRVQGVLSRRDLGAMATARPGSQADQLTKDFLAQQRGQAAAGLTQAVSGLSNLMAIDDAEREQLLAGISDRSEQARVIDARLKEKAQFVMTNFGAGVRAASAGLFVLFDDAIRRGESAVSALSNLAAPMAQLEEIFTRSGATPGAGFAQMKSLMDIVNGQETGPALQVGSGLGSALSGLQNTGLLSPELFQEMSAGIAESYYNLERMGKGGIDAARLLQPGLQTIWQLQQDFGYEVDESTQKLIDFAESSGIIGDKFRPAEERMAAGIDRLVELFEGMTQGFGETFASDAQEGAEAASQNILDVFGRLKPKVTVEYVYKQPTDDDVFGRSTGGGPSRTTSTDTTRTATTQTTGGGVYLDGQQVGYHTARYIDGVANWIGA